VEAAKKHLNAYLATLEPLEIQKQDDPPEPPGKPEPHLVQRGNGVWYIFYYDAAGVRQRKSCNTTDKVEARAQLERAIAERDKPEAPPDRTIGAILDGYMSDRGVHTVGHKQLISTIAALKYDLGNLMPDDITDALMRKYLANQRQRGAGGKPRCAGTVAKDMSMLRVALRWAVRHKWIAEEPIFRSPAGQQAPRDRWLTRDEFARLLDACELPHLRLFVLLALHTTKRSSAILSLRWPNIRNGVIHFGQGSGNKRRGDIPMNETVAEAVFEARQRATSEWVVEYGGGRVGSVKKGFGAACQRAGLEDVTPHVLRHTAATWMALAGVPMSEIARVLGNSEKVCERIYAKYHPAYLRRAVSVLEAEPDPLAQVSQRAGFR
jgi:integrase